MDNTSNVVEGLKLVELVFDALPEFKTGTRTYVVNNADCKAIVTEAADTIERLRALVIDCGTAIAAAEHACGHKAAPSEIYDRINRESAMIAAAEGGE